MLSAPATSRSYRGRRSSRPSLSCSSTCSATFSMESSIHAFASRATSRVDRRRARAARRRGSTRAQLVVGCALLGLLALAAVLVPVVSSYGPNDLVAAPLQAPSSAHLFG